MGMLLAVVIALIALILAPGQLFFYDVTPKIVVLLLGTAAVLCFALPRTPRSRSFSLLIILSVASIALSTAFSVNPVFSLAGTNWRRFGLFTQAAVLIFAWLLAGHTAGRPARLRTVLRGVAVAGAMISLYGIAQYFGWDPILPPAGYHVGGGLGVIVRPPGTLGHASYFATWLAATVFLDLALAQMETGGWRYAAMTCAGFAAVAAVLTGTRAAMLGLAAGGVVWLIRRGFRVSPRMLAAAAVVAIAAIAFYYSPPGWQLRSRARWFREDPWGGARLALWRDSAAMALRGPVLGYGPEVFTANFPHFESKPLARAYPDFLYESPHNIFLDAWIAQGLPGPAVLLGFCWIGFRVLWKRKEPAAAWLTAALTGVLVCQQFTVFTMPTALIFYVIIALGVAIGASPAVEHRGGVVSFARMAVALGCVLVAANLVYTDGLREQAKKALQAGDLRSAKVYYDRAGGADLWFSRACIDAARKSADPIARLQAVSMAGAAAERGTRTAEDPFNAWYNLAVLYGLQNNAAGAESSLRAAIVARPNWFKPHWMLSQVLRVEGRTDEARSEAAVAVDLANGKHSEISAPQL